jgi:hypothetical protein
LRRRLRFPEIDQVQCVVGTLLDTSTATTQRTLGYVVRCLNIALLEELVSLYRPVYAVVDLEELRYCLMVFRVLLAHLLDLRLGIL